MADYKTLYEQQLAENNKLKQENQEHTEGLIEKFKKLQEEQTEFYEKIQKENLDTILILTEQVKNLKEQVNYWKNFALFYWSGHQLGEEANSDSDVWNEALEECNSSNNDDYDREALTKKCLSQ